MFNKIKKLCEEKNITIYKLCKDTGVSQQTLRMIEVRKGNLSAINLYKVAKYLDKPMEYFIDESKE